MTRPLRILTVGHSYVVALNRMLPNEMARIAGAGAEVLAVAPDRFPGDLRPLALERTEGGACAVEAVPVRGAGRIHLMTYGGELRRILARGWDVVHCWEEPYVAAAWQVARWTPPGAALVYATFQNLAKRYPPPFSWMEGAALRRADGWIAFGETVREALGGRDGYRDRPHAVVPPAIDTARFSPDEDDGRALRRALGWEGDVPVVGYLGRFVPEKGLETMMRALDGVAAPWRALVVGGGPMEAELRRWAAGHGDRVRVVTGVAHGDVPRHLRAMDALCAPSRTTPRWREQFGRMAAEALACGVPVVAAASGELPHVVGDAGVLVAEDDVPAWTAALSDLLADGERRRALGRRGVARAAERFAPAVVARATLDFFAAVHARRTGAAA
jgi:glycosyltransferase involved in cell wall biosynthesis